MSDGWCFDDFEYPVNQDYAEELKGDIDPKLGQSPLVEQKPKAWKPTKEDRADLVTEIVQQAGDGKIQQPQPAAQQVTGQDAVAGKTGGIPYVEGADGLMSPSVDVARPAQPERSFWSVRLQEMQAAGQPLPPTVKVKCSGCGLLVEKIAVDGEQDTCPKCKLTG